jgi:hypothetical protein
VAGRARVRLAGQPFRRQAGQEVIREETGGRDCLRPEPCPFVVGPFGWSRSSLLLSQVMDNELFVSALFEVTCEAPCAGPNHSDADPTQFLTCIAVGPLTVGWAADLRAGCVEGAEALEETRDCLFGSTATPADTHRFEEDTPRTFAHPTIHCLQGGVLILPSPREEKPRHV